MNGPLLMETNIIFNDHKRPCCCCCFEIKVVCSFSFGVTECGDKIGLKWSFIFFRKGKKFKIATIISKAVYLWCVDRSLAKVEIQIKGQVTSELRIHENNCES